MSVAPLYATFWRRWWAAEADLFVFAPLAAFDAWIQHGAVATSARAVWFACNVAVIPAYRIYAHGRFGQTLGKWLLRVSVVDVSDAPLTMGQAFRREAVNLPFFLWILCAGIVLILHGQSPHDATMDGVYGPPAALMFGLVGLELISTLGSSKRRALHDLIAGSVVIRLDVPHAATSQSAASPALGVSDGK